eukprot:g12644.t1
MRQQRLAAAAAGGGHAGGSLGGPPTERALSQTKPEPTGLDEPAEDVGVGVYGGCGSWRAEGRATCVRLLNCEAKPNPSRIGDHPAK